LTYPIDGYDRYRPRMPPSMPSHEGSSTTLTNSDNDLCRDTRAKSSVLHGRSLSEFSSGDKEELRSEAPEQRNWVNRVSELRTGAKLSIGRSFLLFLLFSSLLHTLLHHWISARYKWHRHGFSHLRISVKGRWSFPVRRIHRKAAVWCQSVAGLFSLYEYVRGMIV